MIKNNLCGRHLVLIDAIGKFRLKEATDKGAQKLYEQYIQIREENFNKLCPISITYLEAFVHYPPVECIRVMWRKKGRFLTLTYWGSDYVHLLSLIASYHVDNGNLKQGVYWANKAVQVINYFSPNLDLADRKSILNESTACGIIYSYAAIFYIIDHHSFKLKWELKNPICYSNDN